MKEINDALVYSYSSPKTLKRFLEQNSFVREGKYPISKSIKRFLETGRRTHPSNASEIDKPPYLDHARVFSQRKGGFRCIVSQPYRTPSDIKNGLQNWADSCDLIVDLYGTSNSFYNPGGTCIFIIHLPGVKIAEPGDAFKERTRNSRLLKKALGSRKEADSKFINEMVSELFPETAGYETFRSAVNVIRRELTTLDINYERRGRRA